MKILTNIIVFNPSMDDRIADKIHLDVNDVPQINLVDLFRNVISMLVIGIALSILILSLAGK